MRKILVALLLSVTGGAIATPLKKPVIFSQDGNSDDLLALIFILASHKIDLQGVLVTPADCYLEPAMEASRQVLSFFDHKHVPVLGEPLAGEHAFPREWRAMSYLIPALPMLLRQTLPPRPAIQPSSVTWLKEKLHTSKQPISLVVTGPPTHLVQALTQEPALKKNIKEVFWMGGALRVPGNVLDHEHNGSAEWNAYWDPSATQALFELELPLWLVPLDATNSVPVSMDFLKRLAQQSVQYPVSDLCGQIWAGTVGTIPSAHYTYFMWDTLTAGLFLHPELATWEMLSVKAFSKQPQAGTTVIDPEGKAPKINVATRINSDAFHTYVLELLRQAPIGL